MKNVIQKDNTNRIIDFLCKKRGKSATLTEIATGVPYICAKERRILLDDLTRRELIKKVIIYHGGETGTRFKREEYSVNYAKVFSK